MAYVSVDVDIKEFDAEDVLLRAIQIIELSNSGECGARVVALVRRIGTMLTIDEDDLPPPSTAARVESLSQIASLSRKAQGIAT